MPKLERAVIGASRIHSVSRAGIGRAIAIAPMALLGGALSLAGMAGMAGTARAAESAIEVSQVIVTASRTGLEAREVGSAITVKTAKDIQAQQIVFAKELLQDIPGVQITSDRPGAFTSISIRGSDNDQVLFLVDGIELGDPSSTSTQFQSDHLLAGDVDRMEVLRGNQSSLYGSDAIGGVVNIISKRATKAGHTVNVQAEGGSHGSRSAGVSLLGKQGAVDYRLTATGDHYDGPSLADANLGPAAENDAYSRWGVSGRVGVALSDYLKAQVVGFYDKSSSDLDGTGEDNGPYDSYKVDKNEYAVAGQLIHSTLEGRWTNQFLASRYWAQSDYKGPSNLLAGDRYEGHRDVLKYVGAFRVNDTLKLAGGVSHGREVTDQLTAYSGHFQADISTTSVFGELALTPLDKLSVTLAGRRDDNSRFGAFNTYRATAAYMIEDAFAGGDIKLRASYGTGAKAPGLYQLFDPTYGNTNLKAERSQGADVGMDLYWSSLKLEATLFTNRVRNEIDFGFNGVGYGYIQHGATRSNGVELGGALQATPWLSVSQSYTYLEAQDTDLDAWLGRPRHSGSTAVTVNPTERIALTTRVRYRSRNTSSYGGETAAYGVVDLLGSYAVTPRVQAYARVVNLLDADYQVSFGENALDRSLYVGVRASF